MGRGAPATDRGISPPPVVSSGARGAWPPTIPAVSNSARGAWPPATYRGGSPSNGARGEQPPATDRGGSRSSGARGEQPPADSDGDRGTRPPISIEGDFDRVLTAHHLAVVATCEPTRFSPVKMAFGLAACGYGSCSGPVTRAGLALCCRWGLVGLFGTTLESDVSCGGRFVQCNPRCPLDRLVVEDGAAHEVLAVGAAEDVRQRPMRRWPCRLSR